MRLSTLKTIQANFLNELQKAKSGKPSSLSFIINKIPSIPLVQNEEAFQVLSIGGGITKVALVKKRGRFIELLEQTTYNQAPFKTKQDLLLAIQKYLRPQVTILGINFAQSLSPISNNGKIDGILLNGTKESTFQRLIGKRVGFEIEQYFKRKKRNINVCIANDAVCILLSGLVKYPWETLAGGIVGTGLNFSLFLAKDRLVNLEAGNFDKLPQTKEGQCIDKSSTMPGAYVFEKETAGGYLYKHFNSALKKKRLSFPPITETKELDDVVLKNLPIVSKLAQNILQRSAQLVACQIAGITLFKQKNMVFIMEGSLFWKGYRYKETVEETVKKLVPNYNISFVEISNSPIIGATKLVS